MYQKVFEQTRKSLTSNRRYLTEYDYNYYMKYYETYMKSFNTDIELVHKNSIYISFYKKRLETLKGLHETIKEDLESLNKKILDGKKQVSQAEKQKAKSGSSSILGAIFGLIGALMPEKEVNDLKVGDHVRVHGADGEIQEIYKDGDKYQYDVLYEREEPLSDGDDEDEDVFFRDEIEKEDE